MDRPRVHTLVLETVGPTESLVLGALAKHFECGIEHLPARLVADVRAALMAGLRPVFAELDRLATMPEPIADALEPAQPPPVPQSQRPTRPAPPPYVLVDREDAKATTTTPDGWDDDVTPLLEGYPVDMSEAETSPETVRARLYQRPTRRTLPSQPPPPPEALSSRLKRRP